MNLNKKKIWPVVRDWLVALVCVVTATVLFYILIFTGAMPWYLVLMDAAGDTVWAGVLSSGVPGGMGAMAGSLYLNAARKRRTKAQPEEDPR